MITCTTDMFEKDNNFTLDESQKAAYQTRLCPDANAIKDWWKLKNEYSSMERKSFNVQVALCDNSTSEVPCAPLNHTIFLLDKLMFKLYVLEDYIQFKEIGKLPYTTIDKFHS